MRANTKIGNSGRWVVGGRTYLGLTSDLPRTYLGLTSDLPRTYLGLRLIRVRFVFWVFNSSSLIFFACIILYLFNISLPARLFAKRKQ